MQSFGPQNRNIHDSLCSPWTKSSHIPRINSKYITMFECSKRRNRIHLWSGLYNHRFGDSLFRKTLCFLNPVLFWWYRHFQRLLLFTYVPWAIFWGGMIPCLEFLCAGWWADEYVYFHNAQCLQCYQYCFWTSRKFIPQVLVNGFDGRKSGGWCISSSLLSKSVLIAPKWRKMDMRGAVKSSGKYVICKSANENSKTLGPSMQKRTTMRVNRLAVQS